MSDVQRGDRLSLSVGDTEYTITVASVETVTVDTGDGFEEWVRVTGRSGEQVTVPHIETGNRHG
jgi:hypothetical protein